MVVSTTSDVVIIGAGIGGLTTCLSLLKAGVNVRVYERTAQLTEVGAGVQISANASRVLRHLGIAEALAAVSGESVSKEIRLWNSGRAWCVPDTGAGSKERYGAPFLMLHRRDLLDTLADAVRSYSSDAICLDSRCTAVEQDADHVAVTFSNGTHVRAKCVIGADGIHSAVRSSVFGREDAAFTGCIAWRGIVRMQDLPSGSKSTVSSNWIGPGRHVITYPVRRGDVLNFVGILGGSDWTVESWTEKGSVEECLADFSGWNEEVREIIRRIEQPYKWALMSRKPMTSWRHGRVGLMGDSCHPTLPFLGSGAGMAIEDGAVLARSIVKYAPDYTKALERFQMSRIKRTTEIVERSAAMLDHFQGDRLADPAQAETFVEREWTPDKVRERYDWIYSYDPYVAAI